MSYFVFNSFIICSLHKLNNCPMREAIKHETEIIKGELAQVIGSTKRIKKPRQ
jgi:hypothetical protein